MRYLLVNPAYGHLYQKSRFNAIMTHGFIPLNLLCVAGELLRLGHRVVILDLNYTPEGDIVEYIKRFDPDIFGITATTPLSDKAKQLCAKAKSYKPTLKTLIGGVHATVMPEDYKDCADIDNVYCGEFEEYRHDLDSIPFPAYELIYPERYTSSPLLSRRSPVGLLETSRGCYGKCCYCTRAVQGKTLRFKSPMLVIEEIKYVLGRGFREIHFIDDNLTADQNRAHDIFEKCIKDNISFTWTPRNGVRANRLSRELLSVMKRSGCYRIPIGVESGSQKVLDRTGKGVRLEEVERAVQWCKEIGLETELYFMIGLPGETEEDLQKTCDFAAKLKPDFAKIAPAIPYPGTGLNDYLQNRGLLRSKDYSLYHYSGRVEEIYTHDTLSWNIINKYIKRFYINLYMRPGYIGRALIRAIKTKTLLESMRVAWKTQW